MNKSTSSGGIGFLGILGIVFIVLKLVGIINWSWWWVLAPIWIPFIVWLTIILFALLMYLIFQRKR